MKIKNKKKYVGNNNISAKENEIETNVVTMH